MIAPRSDLDPLARRAAGDERALDELLTTIRDDVNRICRRFLPNAADAEDATQDTLLAISRQIPTFEGRASFRTWMYQIAANRARETYGRLRTQHEHLGSAEVDALPADRRTSVIAGTRLDLIEAATVVGDLYAGPVLLRDVCDLEYADIADALDVPLGTVKSRIAEGRRRLATRMRDTNEAS